MPFGIVISYSSACAIKYGVQNTTHTVTMTPTEAELTKYFSNTYKAMRVTFANAFYNLCQTMGSDYDKVRDAFLFHGVGDGHYLKVNKQ